MASWQHLALGAVAATGVGLALYHAKNCKMEERLEKERTQLYNDVRNGDARFVHRVTDPQRARNKWRQMDMHERKAALFINRYLKSKCQYWIFFLSILSSAVF